MSNLEKQLEPWINDQYVVNIIKDYAGLEHETQIVLFQTFTHIYGLVEIVMSYWRQDIPALNQRSSSFNVVLSDSLHDHPKHNAQLLHSLLDFQDNDHYEMIVINCSTKHDETEWKTKFPSALAYNCSSDTEINSIINKSRDKRCQKIANAFKNKDTVEWNQIAIKHSVQIVIFVDNTVKLDHTFMLDLKRSRRNTCSNIWLVAPIYNFQVSNLRSRQYSETVDLYVYNGKLVRNGFFLSYIYRLCQETNITQVFDSLDLENQKLNYALLVYTDRRPFFFYIHPFSPPWYY
jgi:hypothetical protein